MLILFIGQIYYASGGANDAAGVFNTIEEAAEALRGTSGGEWANLLDPQTGEVVAYWHRPRTSWTDPPGLWQRDDSYAGNRISGIRTWPCAGWLVGRRVRPQ